MNQLPQFNELGEPSEQDNPVPLVIILLIASLVVWGAMYIFNVSLYIEDKVSARVVNYGTVQQEPASAPAPAPAKETPAASPSGGGEGAGGAVTANGKSVYAGKCAACHQATGKGLPGVFPPLDGSEWVTTDNIDIPLQIVLHGIKGSIMVNGTKYSGAMPAFASNLSDDEAAAVVNYIRTSWSNSATEPRWQMRKRPGMHALQRLPGVMTSTAPSALR